MFDFEERRRDPRQRLARGCKVFYWPTQRYLAAKTCDVSAGGALLRIDCARPLAEDEQLDVIVPPGEAGFALSRDQRRARVVRSRTGRDGEQLVAVEFERDVAMAA